MADKTYQVTVPDVEYYRSKIKCQAACPVNTDARGYIMAIGAGDFERAYRISREPNPLASTCGAVCGAPCEVACRRGVIDQPLSIRALKKAATNSFGPEARWTPGRAEVLPLKPLGATELDEGIARWSRSNLRKLAATPGHKSGNVAIVGGGPAGMTVAHDLTLLGHKVTLFEAGPALSGMVRYGVPVYRVDRNLLDAEAQEIIDLGVDVRLDTPIGEDITLNDLRQEFDAVFLGIGLMKGRTLPIEGIDLDGVITAVDMLLNFNMGYKVRLGKKVLVVGGGDVAMDAARAALRLGQKPGQAVDPDEAREAALEADSEAIHSALDVARTAIRLGVADVKMIALESWEELPASDLEVVETLEEGIEVHPRVGPKRIIGKDGKVVGLETLDVLSVFDEEGRFRPKFKEGSERIWEVDTLILAIGQQADLLALGGADDVEISPRGLVSIDPETLQTTAPDVFAGGDVAFGPRLIISAVRDGHIAALGIDERIQQREAAWVTKAIWEQRPRIQRHLDWIDQPRLPVPTQDLDRRTGISQVEIGYRKDEAMLESSRCLECSVHPVFDGDLCVLCNRCVDVCPWSCLKIVSLDMITGDEVLAQTVEARYGMPLADLVSGQNGVIPSVMLKDDESCTRCALCADHCPTGAITMETFRFHEELSYV